MKYLFLLLILTACDRASFQIPESETPNEETLQTPSGPQRLLSRSATPEECVNGGATILIYEDINNNSSFDENDSLSDKQVICNGIHGERGQDAELHRYSPVDVIYACGKTSAHQEVLIILRSGDVLTSFSNSLSGEMTRLILLPDGTYMNSDGSGCIFTIGTSEDGLKRFVKWSGEIQKEWAIL